MAVSKPIATGGTPAPEPESSVLAAQELAAVGVTAVLAEEFNQLHDGHFDIKRPPEPEVLFKAIHDLPAGQRQSALCLSGGGIRSASFALGVLQGLAKERILENFHYLSTVSGGGYIGAWLSVWRNRIGKDPVLKDALLKDPSLKVPPLMSMLSERRQEEKTVLQVAEKDLNPPEAQRYKPEDAYKEPVEFTVLREHSNFLTPNLGAMSADTWTLVALYLRNLLLNWTVYLPLIFMALLVPMMSFDVLKWAQRRDLVDVHHVVLGLAVILFAFAVYTSVRGRLSQDNEQRVDQKTFLLCELVPIYLAATLVSIYSVGECNTLEILGNHKPPIANLGEGCLVRNIGWRLAGLAGAFIYLVGWLPAFARFGTMERPFAMPTSAEPFSPGLLWLPWTVAGAAAGALVGIGLDQASHHLGDPRLIVIFGVAWISVSIFLANGLYLGLTSLSRLGDVEREWLARSSGWFVAVTVAWAGYSALVLYTPELVGLWQVKVGVLVSGGLGAAAAKMGASARTLASFLKSDGEKELPMSTILALASVVFLLAMVLVLSYALPHLRDWIEIKWGVAHHPARHNAIALVIFALIGSGAIYFINVNRFSAHSLYRNRLIRAFMGAGRGPNALHSKTSDPFTGFDRKDNVFVKDLIFPIDKARLFPVVNMALNTVAGSNKAWQERKAESFTVTPLRSGNEWVKYWPTKNYGSKEKGLGLGTAIAISGAAASPNMGYHSSPLVGLIMTLFNVRLGWWLGNPSKPDTAPLESPPYGMVQFVQELFGLTQDTSHFVYLSDGGHFENLGLYEMVRRRNHFILVSDAGCDPKAAFEDLGNAVRKIRIDLGVEIKFKKLVLQKRAQPGEIGNGIYCAVGTIKYPENSVTGHLLYIKPCFHGTEPADVRAYAAGSKDFPHETTGDQFFSESQMESYRMLGAHVMETILGTAASPSDGTAPLTSLGPYWARIRSFGA
jgi:hypothetical protein